MSDGIKIEGRIVETLPHTLFRVELANGHRLVAHVAPRLRKTLAGLSAGDTVTLKMTPFDFSKGCIIEN